MHFSRGSCLFLKIHDTKNCVRLRTTTTTNFSNSTGTLETKRNRISNIGEWKRIILIHPPWNYRARFPSNLKTSVVNLKRNTNVHPAPRCNWNCPNFCETSFKDFFPPLSSFFLFFISRLKVQAEILEKKKKKKKKRKEIGESKHAFLFTYIYNLSQLRFIFVEK